VKRLGFFVVCLILAGLFLGSCDNGTGAKTQYYYYEGFRILESSLGAVPTPSAPTFSAIKSYRDSLKTYSVEFLISGTDTTQDELYSLLTQRGMTPSEANEEIDFLNSIGNNILFADYALDNRYVIIIYLEKL
jgi:hypothetical protein